MLIKYAKAPPARTARAQSGSGSADLQVRVSGCQFMNESASAGGTVFADELNPNVNGRWPPPDSRSFDSGSQEARSSAQDDDHWKEASFGRHNRCTSISLGREIKCLSGEEQSFTRSAHAQSFSAPRRSEKTPRHPHRRRAATRLCGSPSPTRVPD